MSFTQDEYSSLVYQTELKFQVTLCIAKVFPDPCFILTCVSSSVCLFVIPEFSNSQRQKKGKNVCKLLKIKSSVSVSGPTGFLRSKVQNIYFSGFFFFFNCSRIITKTKNQRYNLLWTTLRNFLSSVTKHYSIFHKAGSLQEALCHQLPGVSNSENSNLGIKQDTEHKKFQYNSDDLYNYIQKAQQQRKNTAFLNFQACAISHSLSTTLMSPPILTILILLVVPHNGKIHLLFPPQRIQRAIKMTMEKKSTNGRRFLCCTMNKQTQFFYILNNDNSTALICKMFYLKHMLGKKERTKKPTQILLSKQALLQYAMRWLIWEANELV